MPTEDQKDRREFMADAIRTSGVIAIAGGGGFLTGKRTTAENDGEPMVWQLDPDKCTACGNCATYCVLDVSAVKCFNAFDMCGFCDICTGYFEMDYESLDTAAENQACPTGAIVRKFVEEKSGQRFYEYTIDEPLCIGCAKCVKGCALMNGSMYLQVEHDRCLDCNECAIATACPTEAFYRIPASQAEIMKRRGAAVLNARGNQMLRTASGDQAKLDEANQLLSRTAVQRDWREQQANQENGGSTSDG
ncbi:Electron transport complex subunit RsxB [Planctomycetes bacterium CA13]|uniref:Electron transport complex subunit RsxB n=1 Tax=Novipirellula herctigrandis TaxID=2527986 RepID=A0A5C5YXN6_9BACT|nr:Electron transport complex subunit RsxB [Planctomycetes bacterium CA13]